MKFKLQQNMWQGFEPVEISLPDYWDIEYVGIKADEMPGLSREEIRKRINAPFGLKPLKELAQGAERVAIAFDDISRATPTRILAEIVLEELHSAGIKNDQIRFICALGCHAAHDRNDFVEKLGEDIVKNYSVYNHNCYENLTLIGNTKRGIPVYINKEFMSCDLKIGLGAIIPHAFNTFGGGGKILFPGLASIDTIESNHTTATNLCKKYDIISAEVMGDMRVSGMRHEVEEMTRMVGQFYKIDCLYNTKQEIVDLYAGDPIEEYYAAIPAAKELYVSKRIKDKQVVIVNANARPNEASIAVSIAGLAIAQSGGDIVVINHTKMGQVVHYLFSKFGDNATGRLFGFSKKVRDNVRRIICYMPHAAAIDSNSFGDRSKQIYVKTWEEVMELLKDHGPGTRAAVMADGTMQYYEIDENADYIKRMQPE